MRALLGVAVVVVRVYDVTGISYADRRAALDVAHELLASANAHVVFKVCRSDEPHGEACDTVPGPQERIVRIINGPAPPRPSAVEPLGNAVVDAVTNTGVFATVYADRVARKAAGRVDPNLLLGRTIAHELGHLLLGIRTHSPSGLMREFWSDQELQQNHARDWAFSPADRWQMCVKLLGRRSLCSDQATASASASRSPPADSKSRR